MSAAQVTVPALSIRQPWAWLILHGGKDVENRTWRTQFRGRFFIHASKGMTKTEFNACRQFVVREFPGIWLPPAHALPLGGIVGEVELVDCVGETSSRWFAGHWAFVLRNPITLPFIPCAGSLRFFNVPLSLVTREDGQ